MALFEHHEAKVVMTLDTIMHTVSYDMRSLMNPLLGETSMCRMFQQKKLAFANVILQEK